MIGNQKNISNQNIFDNIISVKGISNGIKGALNQVRGVSVNNISVKNILKKSLLGKNLLCKGLTTFLSIFYLSLILNHIFILDTTLCMQQSSTNPDRHIQGPEAKQVATGMASSQTHTKKQGKIVYGYFNLDFTSAHTHILTMASLFLCFFLSLNVMNNFQSNTANSNLIEIIFSGTTEIQQSQDNIRHNQKKFKCLIETKNDLAACNVTSNSNLRIMSEMNFSSIYNDIDFINEYSAQTSNFSLTSLALNILMCSSVIILSVIAIKKIWIPRNSSSSRIN